ncbi:D-2-hydroxyacid dehydrogenase [Campylobacter hepaticus]|uniref:D-2-hydroxyacid dehydrogenase n=1 Tax=Campylobacter hepaticus TaxID=1813019 RepID=A0A6A7JQL8_9BACT|nr:D-2-hydroxyacid dehydrogenase [Campylobacter hepaticus]AXP09467.1 D-2-hydroxyacid dehydrogenase [Campylobacter hepaticus]MCZ0772788.1 D-2-hydroxyacid dehydrogenase [Campylobacter hepaticus]MCZ0774256.1 D-2-hydroxyacid dehydrogenase [Campylobacter hepaticus]MCZ0775508.1 D-2-hydroxyacid dehydrogenase [Campylobacter hepaticus]MDX2323209.1 D-2-hydroxyacid dehydrogenase [Campylobacter hepaticus]
MKIVCLDAATLGTYDLSIFKQLGSLEVYNTTSKEQTIERLKDADVVMTNKVVIDKKVIDACGNLKLILETATGVNNIDVEYAKQKGIIVKNAAGYSTMSVVQHTFALIFAFLNHVVYYTQWSQEGKWCNSPIFTDYSRILNTLNGKKHGIIGLGAIGKEVAKISQTFGAQIYYYSTSGTNHNLDFIHLSLDELLKSCDIVSIHAPLNAKTYNLLNFNNLRFLKDGAILVNVGRGGIINEIDLAKIIDEKNIRVALDVLEYEPMIENHPLLNIQNKENLIITPHVAWASKEALSVLMDMVFNNLKEWIENGK